MGGIVDGPPLFATVPSVVTIKPLDLLKTRPLDVSGKVCDFILYITGRHNGNKIKPDGQVSEGMYSLTIV